ncbi:hypothetical protein BpHYR1_007600 [Brachionus plicatilis]|uniref:Uncharacterized protein n=1 Tax=Brachionus plicatilis TaxID=10195 RepID=A0A3M7R299_BRAPC|nr:hypothetical protein BpHYR1_007600 [Brachionus plicatilis]
MEFFDALKRALDLSDDRKLVSLNSFYFIYLKIIWAGAPGSSERLYFALGNILHLSLIKSKRYLYPRASQSNKN